jgi:hypothetical protein
MTELDRQLEQLAALINALSQRAQASVFWAASTAYSQSARWRPEESTDARNLLLHAQDAAYAFCLGGSLVDRGGALLALLDRPLPEHVVAQSAWICADTALRVAVEDAFESGMSVEYALEPVVGRVSEELFGFWQVGSGEAEDEQVAEIMSHPDVVAAVGFFRWAVAELAVADTPSAAVLEDVSARAAILADRRPDL